MSLSNLPTFTETSKSRLQALYSDISRQKHSNPTSFHTNVDWWRRTLQALVSRGWQARIADAIETNRLVLSAERGIAERLRYEGVGKPLGLGAVVAELRSTKALIPLSQFLTGTQSVYDPGWLPYRIASYVVGKPLWWALEQLELVKPEDGYTEVELWKRVTGEYAVLALVESAADAVMRIREAEGGSGVADALFDFEGFKKEFAGKANVDGPLSEVDVKVLVKLLERDRKLVVVDKEIIKFVDGARNAEITAVDRGILELKSAVQNLHAQVEDIQRKVDGCTTKASAALAQKRKPIALSYLRSRKQLEELLTKRLGSLGILQSTLIQVEGAAGDAEIMKSYESSTATLRMILAHPSLQRDKIDETMDAMASASADARDVEDAIRMGSDSAAAEAGIDESELEAELQALVRDSEMETHEKQATETLERLGREGMRAPVAIPAGASYGEGSRQAKGPHISSVAAV